MKALTRFKLNSNKSNIPYQEFDIVLSSSPIFLKNSNIILFKMVTIKREPN